jgi:hypothetical protein
VTHFFVIQTISSFLFMVSLKYPKMFMPFPALLGQLQLTLVAQRFRPTASI